MHKRTNYLSWNEYFMRLALLTAQRSKDPSTQVGACIVDMNSRVVGLGYNGLPNFCNDDLFPWGRDGEFLETKYPYVVHAELNAILNARGSLEGGTMYCTLFPCNECAKAIIQSGISEIIYLHDTYKNTDSGVAAQRMFDHAGVVFTQLGWDSVCPACGCEEADETCLDEASPVNQK